MCTPSPQGYSIIVLNLSQPRLDFALPQRNRKEDWNKNVIDDNGSYSIPVIVWIMLQHIDAGLSIPVPGETWNVRNETENVKVC